MPKPTKNKDQTLTLRQQLRIDAAKQLSKLAADSTVAVEAVVSDGPVKAQDIMRLCAGGNTRTLADKLTGQLANAMEAELLKIFTERQRSLLGGDDG